jgi:hypothetical protein
MFDTGIKFSADVSPVTQYRAAQSSTGMLRYRTELPDAGMPKPSYATYPYKVGVRSGVVGPGRKAKNRTV